MNTGVQRRGFHPTSRGRNRMAAGLALGAAAIGGNVLVYSSLNRSEPVVQAIDDIPAGEIITIDMVRTVDVSTGAGINVIDGDDIRTVVGLYAKVRLVSGSLVTSEALQVGPLVTDGNAIVAVEVRAGQLPIGLRERVPVRLVVPVNRNAERQDVLSIDGRVVGLPRPSTNALGTVSISIELANTDAATIAAADDVRVILLAPIEDPATGLDVGP